MVIRLAVQDDIDELVPCFKTFKIDLQKDVPNELSKYRKNIKSDDEIAKILKKKICNPSSKFLVATHNEEIVGFVHGIIQDITHDIYEFDNLKEGYLSNLWVKYTYRCRGISTELLNNILNYFRENKCIYTSLYVLESNNAKNIYSNLDYNGYLVRMIKHL